VTSSMVVIPETPFPSCFQRNGRKWTPFFGFSAPTSSSNSIGHQREELTNVAPDGDWCSTAKGRGVVDQATLGRRTSFYFRCDSLALKAKLRQGGRRDFNRHVSVGRPSRFQGLWLLQRRRAAGERDVRFAYQRCALSAPSLTCRLQHLRPRPKQECTESQRTAC
jgi:hypothetical protein